jgi:hypothetical protein
MSLPWSKDSGKKCAYRAARVLSGFLSIAHAEYSLDVIFEGI